MDTNIDNLIQCVSDSIKRKDEEIANLKLKIKNSESVLQTYEKRVRKLEEENKNPQYENENSALKDKITALENSNDAYTQVVIEALGEIPSSIDAFKESIDNRIKAAYKDGYGTAVSKMSACLQEMKFDTIVTTEQKSTTLKVEQESREDEFEKALVENFGNCYFYVNNEDLVDKRLAIASALSKTYKVSTASVIKYLNKVTRNIKPGNYTTILSNASEYICKTLANHIYEKQIGYGWGFIK